MGDQLIVERDQILLFSLSGIAALLVLCIAGFSLLDQSVYVPSTPQEFIPGAVSQDVISFVCGMGLIACIVLIRRGVNSAWLIWLGLLGYLFYAYALYSFDRVYNFFFLGYVAIIGLCVYAIICFFMRARLDFVRPIDTQPKGLRVGAVVLFLVLTLMFFGLWMSILIPAMQSRVPADGTPIFVLDLAFVLPLMLIEAWMLARRVPLGDVLVIPLLMKIGTLGVSVMLGALIAPLFNQPLEFGSIAIYALLGVGPLALVIPFFKSMQITPLQPDA